MSVGILEVALLLVVSIVALFATLLGRNWFFLGMIPLFMVAIIVTPADPVSCLLVGTPLLLIYGFTIRRLSASSTHVNK
ncbi:MAG: hypothetical protein U0992_16845 [Planctomycetaceae bacterium]